MYLRKIAIRQLTVLSNVIEQSNESDFTPRHAILGATLGEPKWLNEIAELRADPIKRLDTIDQVTAVPDMLTLLLPMLEGRSDQYQSNTLSCIFLWAG